MDGPGPSAPRWTPEELRRRRGRSVAIGIALGLLVIMFYAVTIAKLGPQVLNRPL
jgi:threonine/homoserine/homoserine lactone efflux protein